MPRIAPLWIVAALGILIAASPARAQTPPAVSDPGGQILKFAAVDMATLLAAAPKPSIALPQDLKLRLVDYVDCTAETQVHPFLSDGLDRIKQAPAGPYRETGPVANSYFAYRFRVAAPGKPHLVVFEFPDDDDRLTALALAQPPTGDLTRIAARMEFGYRTGDLLALSGKKITRWTFFYPTSPELAALLVASWHPRTPAALARFWVYLVEAPKLPAVENEGPRLLRNAGRYDGDPQVISTSYGGRLDNLIESLGYLGLNEVSFDAFVGHQFNYPSTHFNAGGRSIPDLLAGLEGSGKRLIPVFDPDCSVATFCMPGQASNMADIGEPAVRKVWQEFVDADFLKPYGSKPALAGLMFGGPRGASAFDLKNNAGQTLLATGLAGLLGKQYAGLRVYQNLAAPSPFTHYFQTPAADAAPIARWEVSDKSIDACLTEETSDHWRSYGLDPDALADADHLVLMRQCDRDESASLRFGRNALPRYWLLDAIADSPGVTEAASGGKLTGLVLASRPAPRMILLRPDAFWWAWSEMSPTFPPGGEGFFAPAVKALAAGLEPYCLWLAGNGNQAALHEADVRRWMTAFRNLPYRSFSPLEGAPQYPVAVRTYVYNSQRYVLLANLGPAVATVTVAFDQETPVQSFGPPITGQPSALAFTLSPDDLVAFAISDRVGLKAVRQTGDAVRAELTTRLEQYAAALQAARQAGAVFAPKYETLLVAAREALAKPDLAEADRLLHVAVIREPALRLRLLTERPRADVARLPALAVDGKLDEWPGIVPIRLNSLAHLTAGDTVANHWQGPDDLSAELYLGWNEMGLCFALKVTDAQATDHENESSLLALSAAAYRSHTDRPGYDLSLNLPRRPAEPSPQLATVRSGTTTIHEGFIPMAELPAALQPAAGKTVGLNLVVRDSDDRTGMPQPWCLSNLMAWSNRQDGYQVESDAQTCGEITFK